MARLAKALSAWGSPAFEDILKAGIEQLDPAWLPLQQGLSQSSYVSEDAFSVMLIRVLETPDSLCVKAGIFYSGVIAGCNCADDPSPVDTCTEYCVVQFVIDRKTAETTVELVPE